jgi:hypothetical protein
VSFFARTFFGLLPTPAILSGMDDNSVKIAELRELLESGVSSSSLDGVHTAIDLDSVRREIRRLEAEDETLRVRRPVAASMDLSNLF